ncbi:MAG: hypothetical protein WBB45_09440 [Cyclobacteriaceae bacterium]
MSFNSDIGEMINPGKANKWTKDWKEKHADGTESVFFGKENIQTLLATPGATGIRIHFAINDEGKETLILIPADKNGNNIILSGKGNRSNKNNLTDLSDVEDASASILNGGAGCPPKCNFN